MSNESPTLEQAMQELPRGSGAGSIPGNGSSTQDTKTGAVQKFLTLEELEKLYILNALKATQGNKTRAAELLGITIKTLYNKLHQYGEFDNFSARAAKQAKGE